MSVFQRLGQACGSCCGHAGPSDSELARLSSLVDQQRAAKVQAVKAAGQLRADRKSCTEKSEVRATQGNKVCGELEEQLSEAIQRAEELLEGESRLRARAEAELQRESAKMRSDCQDQFETLEQRLGDQLRHEKARVLELQSKSDRPKDGKAMEAHIACLEEANKGLQVELKVLQQRELDAKAAVQPREELAAKLQVQRDALSREVAGHEGHVRNMPVLQARNADLEARSSELKMQDTAKLNDDIALQKAACVATEALMQSLQAEELVVSEGITNRQREAATLSVELEAAERQASNLEVSEETLHKRLLAVDEQVVALERDLDGAYGDISRLSKDVEEQRDATARVSLLAATNKEVRATESCITQQETQLTTMREELEAHYARLEAKQLKEARQAEQTRQAQQAKQKKLEEERARQARIEARQQRLSAGRAATAAKAGPKAKLTLLPSVPKDPAPKAKAAVPSVQPDKKEGVVGRLMQPQTRLLRSGRGGLRPGGFDAIGVTE